MSVWIDWVMLAISLGLMIVGLRDRQHGRRLALVAGILVAMSTARLLPDSSTFLRGGAWLVAIALVAYVLATTSRETYRKTRVELSLFGAAVAVISILQVPGLPGPIRIALLVALGLLAVAVPLLAIARAPRA